MAGLGDGRRKPKGPSWESWVEQQIRVGMERGDFENLPGKGRPLEGITDASREDVVSSVVPLDTETVVERWRTQPRR